MAMQLFAGALSRIFNIRSGDPKTQMNDLGAGGGAQKLSSKAFIGHWHTGPRCSQCCWQWTNRGSGQGEWTSGGEGPHNTAPLLCVQIHFQPPVDYFGTEDLKGKPGITGCYHFLVSTYVTKNRNLYLFIFLHLFSPASLYFHTLYLFYFPPPLAFFSNVLLFLLPRFRCTGRIQWDYLCLWADFLRKDTHHGGTVLLKNSKGSPLNVARASTEIHAFSSFLNTVCSSACPDFMSASVMAIILYLSFSASCGN